MATTLSQSELATAAQVVSYLSPPLPLNSAIAFAGNMAQESSFNPLASGDGGVSNGLGQWGGARFTGTGPPMGLKPWCAANGFSPTSVIGQCKFVIYELPTSNGAPTIVPWLYDTSNNGQPTRSLATLTADIVTYYERAGKPELDNRIAYATQIAQYLANAAPAPAPTPIPMPYPTVPMPSPTAPGGAIAMNPLILPILLQLIQQLASNPAILQLVLQLIGPAAQGFASVVAQQVAAATAAQPATVGGGATTPAAPLDPLQLAESIAASLLPKLLAQLQPIPAAPAVPNPPVGSKP